MVRAYRHTHTHSKNGNHTSSPHSFSQLRALDIEIRARIFLNRFIFFIFFSQVDEKCTKIMAACALVISEWLNFNDETHGKKPKTARISNAVVVLVKFRASSKLEQWPSVEVKREQLFFVVPLNYRHLFKSEPKMAESRAASKHLLTRCQFI